MKEFNYRKLSDDALELLEHDSGVRAAFLDFLTVLHDVVSTIAPFGEPPQLNEELQQTRIQELLFNLPENHQIRDTALENREKAFALLDTNMEKEAGTFMLGLLDEYNSVRLLRSQHGRRAFA